MYNNTDQDIDLTDWKIFVSGAPVNLSKINNKIISARGYYLLERKEDLVIRDIVADAIYAFREEFALNGLLKAYNLLVDDEEFKGYERASDEICRADFEKLFKLLYKDKLRESRAVENRRLS